MKVNNPSLLVRAFETLPVAPIYFDVNLRVRELPSLEGLDDLGSRSAEYLKQCEERHINPLQVKFEATGYEPLKIKGISNVLHSPDIFRRIPNKFSLPHTFAEAKFEGREYKAWQNFIREVMPVWANNGYEIADGSHLTLSFCKYPENRPNRDIVLRKGNLSIYHITLEDEKFIGEMNEARLKDWYHGLEYLEKEKD